MNRHMLARVLKLAITSSIALFCLTALHAPAPAIPIYSGLFQTSVSAPHAPPGTSMFFLPGVTDVFEFSRGSALSAASASVSPPGSATALVTGFAGGPGVSSAESGASASILATLVNLNAATVPFPLDLSYTRSLTASRLPLGGGVESTSADLTFQMFLVSGGSVRVPVATSLSCDNFSPDCSIFSSGSEAFVLGLSPGEHLLQIFAHVSGSARSSPPVSPTPEPATLLLFGSTAAGLGLAHWRERRKQRATARTLPLTE
jgi:hypothetical protein